MSREKAKTWLRKYGFPRGESFDVGLFMCAAVYVGIDCRKMSMWSWLPLKRCEIWFERLERSGVFTNGKLTSNWDDIVEFIADSGVAEGKLIKIGDGYKLAE